LSSNSLHKPQEYGGMATFTSDLQFIESFKLLAKEGSARSKNFFLACSVLSILKLLFLYTEILLPMEVKSPCRLICRYDENKMCVGCYRIMQEIVDWVSYTDQEKLEVWKKIKERKGN